MKTKGFLTTIILLGIFAFNITGLKAQDVLNGVYVKEHTRDRKPIPYQFLREADVMWSKTIWRIIELKEKMNHPLYYPEEPIGDRKSLIDLLMWAIQNQGLTAYNYSTYDEFATVMTMKEIEERFGAIDRTIWVDNLEDPDGPQVEKTIEGEYRTADVKQYMIKELWFFDKQRSVLEVRIIGLCPILFSKREDPNDPDASEEIEKKKLFWVYFPEARKIFANNEVFNAHNDAERKSYDDIFFKRLFSSHIFQESNAYNDRRIGAYTIGMETLLEAERIKESIFNFEQDLWEY